MSRVRVYFGTYTGSGSRGIYTALFDPADGSLSALALAAETEQPSFLVLHPGRPLLYAVNEHEVFEGQPTGTVSAFAVDPAAGTLTFLNRQVSHGASPCHLSIDAAGRHLLVANYHGGSIASLPIDAEGRLGEARTVVRHEGAGPNPARQEGPHAHSVYLDPHDRYVLAVDLGLDRVLVYRFDAETGALTPNEASQGVFAPGSGPRHLWFHPTRAFAYVSNELSNAISALSYDPEGGRLTEIHTLPTLPPDFAGENTTAEVQGSPDGRFVYVSNRGHDSLAIFAIDGATGRLTPAGHAATQGRTPRHFAIDPSGGFVLIAHQDSGDVRVFRRNADTGALEPTATRMEIPRVVCVRFQTNG